MIHNTRVRERPWSRSGNALSCAFGKCPSAAICELQTQAGLPTPSPVPHRLVKAPARATLSPKGERVGFCAFRGPIPYALASSLFPIPCSLIPFHAIEAKLCVAMADEAVAAQVSVFFFEKTVARVFRNHQGSRIQKM